MKTINVTTVLLVALLMISCSENEVTEVSPDAHPQMTFGVYTGTSTRGVDTDNTSILDSPDASDKYGGFGIMGYFTGNQKWEDAKATTAPGFMHNQKVAWDSSESAWTYSPTKYWPNNKNDKISFFAYAPYESAWQTGTKAGVIVCDATAKGIPYITFKLKEGDNLPKMVDLVVADKTDQQYTAENGGKVSFQFNHTLARVSFKAKLGEGEFTGMDGDESFVYITEMWIVGSNHGTTSADGNMSLLNTAAPSNSDSRFYTTATWKELHWNYDDAVIPEKDFSLKSMLKTTDGSITESNPTDGHSKTITGVKITEASQTTPVSLFPDKQHLYLIPVGDTNVSPDSGSGCDEGDIQIGFHYDIVSKDKTNSGQYIASHAESVIKLPAGHLKRQKTYQYTLTINLHAITIDQAKVDAWGTEVTESPVE